MYATWLVIQSAAPLASLVLCMRYIYLRYGVIDLGYVCVCGTISFLSLSAFVISDLLGVNSYTAAIWVLIVVSLAFSALYQSFMNVGFVDKYPWISVIFLFGIGTSVLRMLDSYYVLLFGQNPISINMMFWSGDIFGAPVWVGYIDLGLWCIWLLIAMFSTMRQILPSYKYFRSLEFLSFFSVLLIGSLAISAYGMSSTLEAPSSIYSWIAFLVLALFAITHGLPVYIVVAASFAYRALDIIGQIYSLGTIYDWYLSVIILFGTVSIVTVIRGAGLFEIRTKADNEDI